MKRAIADKPGFWETLRLLLRVARKRGVGRIRRQRQMLYNRSGGRSFDMAKAGFVFTAVMMVLLNVVAAIVVTVAVDAGVRLDLEQHGKIAVSPHFYREVLEAEKQAQEFSPPDRAHVPLDYNSEARQLADKHFGQEDEIAQKLRSAFLQHGPDAFVRRSARARFRLTDLATSGPLPGMLGSWVLLVWFVMLLCQGEGLDLDMQRRRDPIWEWLFSHPAPPSAILLAEMLSPIPASPFYWGAPLFAGTLYALVYGVVAGLWAIVLVGVPITVAAACLGKAIEIAVMLRFSPRNRGAIIGLMGWIGYSSMMLVIMGLFALPIVITALAKVLPYFTFIGWPWLKLFLGARGNGTFSFLSGIAACWVASILIIISAVWFAVWSTGEGLIARSAPPNASMKFAGRVQFGKEPLYRKEFLWFLRDRSAIVQVILIPLTIAGVQLFNLRGLVTYSTGAWNYLAGAAILFGTYFLWILGPKSLLSEGNALWIPLTWPRGLEDLLKAKARLWSVIASMIVLLVLIYAAFLFPGEIWKIALVAVGWYFFAASMSEKSVTLVTVVSSSGDQQRVPWSRRLAAQLGMLTFTIGIITQQWHLAIIGVVYSYMTAAAMWQNLRARLPYLFDPWSEVLPPPPTLMHAMVAISLLVEAGAVITGVVIAFLGRQNLAMARAVAYAVCAVVVCVATAWFLSRRGVSLRDVWCWPAAQRPTSRISADQNSGSHVALILLGAAGGLLLGLVAHGYTAALSHIPAAQEIVRAARQQVSDVPHLKISYFITAVLFAPFAEEYLFRGLLFRGLDREWGGWRALLGGAAFFAIYHAPLAWVPVALVGLTNEVLFKRTGRLAPAVVLHMVYNAVVLF